MSLSARGSVCVSLEAGSGSALEVDANRVEMTDCGQWGVRSVGAQMPEAWAMVRVKQNAESMGGLAPQSMELLELLAVVHVGAPCVGIVAS